VYHNIRMNIYTQAENFVGLTEIKNVFMTIPLQKIPTCSGYLEINDQIVFNYERTLCQITQLKQSKYNKMKYERKVSSLNALNEATPSSYYISSLNDIDMNNAQSELDVASVVYDNTHTLKIEEEIKTNTNIYSDYINMIQEFLKKIDYLYVDNKHILTREIIMTSKKYQEYLTKLFKEILELSVYISNHRMHDQKYKDNIEHNGKLVTINTNNYFDQFYEFADDNIIRDKQQLLNKLTTVLFVLIKNIKNSYKMLNAIINTYYVNTKRNQVAHKSYDLICTLALKRKEYAQQLKLNKPLLPTNWRERITSWFVQKKVNGKYKYSLDDYYRYISFWFEENKIINDIRIFDNTINEKEDITGIDYVNFVFGTSITNSHQLEDVMLYSSMYVSPYEKKQN
jgi:hypothetical protein